jgi:hypothetical protein
MHKLNLDLSEKTLKEFAEFGTFILGLVAAPWMIYRGQTTAAVVLWVSAVALKLLALVHPRSLKWPYLVLSIVTWPIGFVVSHLALAVIYYLVFTPVAIIFRLMGRDALKRRFDPQADTYWEEYNPDRGPQRYLRQF